MIFFKHKLKKHLPYYRLTRSAKRRLDEIAAALPPRDTGTVDLTPQAEQEPNGPRHLKQEAPRPIQPMRERPAAAFMRVAVCAVVSIAFIGIFAALMFLRSAAPDILPAASSGVAPSATPTPEPLYTMEIENAETRGGCAFFDVVLTFGEAEYRSAAFYTTALNEQEGVTNTVLSIGGKTAKLDGSPIFYQEATNSRYRASVSAKLPENYEGGPIDAELTISALYGMSFSEDRKAPITEPDFTIEEDCTQSFTLTEAKPWAEVVGAANGVSLEFMSYYPDQELCVLMLKYPDLDGLLPSLEVTDQDGRSLSSRSIEDKESSRIDGNYATQRFTYDGVTADTERLVLRVRFSYFVEETLDTVQVLAAEYTLFPQEDWFMRSGSYQDEGMAEFDMELITANWRRVSLCFSDHIYLTFISPHYTTLDGEYVLPVLNVFLHSDLPWALPLQCEITPTGKEKIVIPLYGNPPPESQKTPGRVYFSVENYERAGLPYRAYSITANFEIDPDFWRENDAQIVIRNTVSGRVLVSTWAIGSNRSDYNGDMDDQATSSEAPADPEPSPDPPAEGPDEPPVESRPDENQPEDGQSSEIPPDDSQSSAADDPEQPVESPPPEGETTPEPDDAG